MRLVSDAQTVLADAVARDHPAGHREGRGAVGMAQDVGVELFLRLHELGFSLRGGQGVLLCPHRDVAGRLLVVGRDVAAHGDTFRQYRFQPGEAGILDNGQRGAGGPRGPGSWGICG